MHEIARHRLSTPGTPRIDDAHYPGRAASGSGPRPPRPRATNEAEEVFLALGSGAHAWLVEAGASGAARVRSKMTAAVDLAAWSVGACPGEGVGV